MNGIIDVVSAAAKAESDSSSISSWKKRVKENGTNLPAWPSRYLKHNFELANVQDREEIFCRLGRFVDYSTAISAVRSHCEHYDISRVVDQWARFSRPATMGVVISFAISEPSAVSS